MGTETRKIHETYSKFINKKVLFIVVSTILLLFFIVVGLTLGSADISLKEVFNTIFGQGTVITSQIIWKIRLPRVLSAVIAGIGLAIVGAAMQSILRNPLGSPFTLGLSNAAAFGAAFAVVILGAGSIHSSDSDAVLINNPYIVTLSAFFWCTIATLAILIVVKLKLASPETMVLMGVIIGSLFGACTTALEYFANEIQLASIVFWTFGDLGRSDWRSFSILFLIIIPGTFYFIKNSWNYAALNSGDETAESLGVDTNKIRIRGMLVASIITATVVAFFGIIAFIGLVVPHIVRRFVGNNERFLLPATALFGALFLLLSDTLARTIIAPVILPVGILTSFLGAPLFLYLLIKGKGRTIT
ncbi:MAG: iron chelate uptake ABC transporter family permease subunit [Candidatus Heimdallarchaeota archaeon]|nr:iron chelate uptake ABC transporter family permease subunit [Candidatus Heimdallarchaeota archaeon]